MGLDMNLYRKKYVKNWDYMKPSERHTVSVKKGRLIRRDINPDKVVFIVEEVAEWRKANAIHAWFVNNVQDGNDDCQSHWVSSEKLAELRDLCKQVLDSSELVESKVVNGYKLAKNENGEIEHIPQYEDGKTIKDPSTAKELLPTTEGFFFGSTDYNEWYYDDIKYTFEVLDEALKQDEGADYEYDSSW